MQSGKSGNQVFLILGNFASSMVELQLRGSHQEIFKSLDVAFTVVFLVELLMNMLCHWFWEFWGSAFNGESIKSQYENVVSHTNSCQCVMCQMISVDAHCRAWQCLILSSSS